MRKSCAPFRRTHFHCAFYQSPGSCWAMGTTVTLMVLPVLGQAILVFVSLVEDYQERYNFRKACETGKSVRLCFLDSLFFLIDVTFIIHDGHYRSDHHEETRVTCVLVSSHQFYHRLYSSRCGFQRWTVGTFQNKNNYKRNWNGRVCKCDCDCETLPFPDVISRFIVFLHSELENILVF